MKTLITQQELNSGITNMAREINSRIGNTPLTVVCIMTGSIILVADLIRNFQMPVRLGILSASSYRGNMIRDQLTLDTQMLPSITDQHVLIVDDIFDTGHTLSEVTQHIQSLGPATIHTAVLLRKSGRQEIEFDVDFVGFEIPDEFVVGYGLDYQDLYRNLPFVAVLDDSEINQIANSDHDQPGE
ncbi:MAG: hypoxanthine phosphoribosyltransferase [Planctomycetota bacterium]|nr:hypoxanthine phosphoribosyltransferase [Planctomycetota bacterium]